VLEDKDRLRVALVFIFVLAAVAAYYFSRTNQFDVICQATLRVSMAAIFFSSFASS